MQIFYSAFLYVLGVVFARIFFDSRSFALITGFLWGLLLSVIPSFLSLLLLGSFNLYFYYSSWAIVIASILFLIISKKEILFFKTEAPFLGGSIILLILISSIFTKYILTVGSYDSLACYVQPGIQIFSGLWQDFAYRFSSIGVFTSLAHGTVSLWGDDYYYLLHPLIFISLLLLFIWTFFQLYPCRKSKSNLFIFSLVGSWIISSPMVLFNVFYVHTHMTSAAYLFLAVSCIQYALHNKIPAMLTLSFFSLLGLSLIRLETPLLAVGLIFFLGVFYEHFENAPLWPLFIFLLPPALWNLRLVIMLKGDGDIAGPFLLGGQAAGLMLFPFFIWILRKIRTNKKYLQNLALLSYFAFISLLATIFRKKISINIFTMFMRSFFVGRWGSLWWGALFILLLIPGTLRNNEDAHPLLRYCIFYVLSIIFLGFMRIPYHLSPLDSANRMMITIIPVVFFSLLSSINRAFKMGKRRL